MNTLRVRTWYFLLTVTQLCISLFAFFDHFSKPTETVFCTWGDGIRNYFSQRNYIAPHNSAFFSYKWFAYPFGDTVHYTDNTPLFSIIMRWFCQNVVDVSGYSQAIFNLIIISNFLLCSLVLFWIFRKLQLPLILGFVSAIVLPWVSPQIHRIWCGHYNLSLSVLIVLGIVLFMLWAKQKKNLAKQLWMSVVIVLYTVCCSFVHMYYLPILGIFISGMMFIFAWSREKNKRIAQLLQSILVPIIAVVISYSLLLISDPFLGLRKVAAMGYDNPDQKTIFSFLFSGYPFQAIKFPLHTLKNTEVAEQASYLGNMGLGILGFMFLGSMLSISFRKKLIDSQKQFFAQPILRSIFFSGLVLLSISFGEYYTAQAEPLTFVLWGNAKGNNISIVDSIALLVLAVLLSFLLWKGLRNLNFKESIGFRNFLWVSAGLALVALLWAGIRFSLDNLLNPFYYVHFFTSRVEQFRSITRFNWPFFISFNLWAFVSFALLLKKLDMVIAGLLQMVIVVLGIVEVKDNVLFLKEKCNEKNPFANAALCISQPPHIDFAKYQCLLPFPYFLQGSEDYSMTFDDENGFSTMIMQLSLYNHMPTMACKLGRTPPIFSKYLIDFVGYDIISDSLRSMLNNKPILIVCDPQKLKDTNSTYQPDPNIFPIARKSYMATTTFIERHQLIPIDSLNGILYYEYLVPKK